MRSTAKQKNRPSCRSSTRVSAQLLLSFLAATASPALGAINEPNAQIILPVLDSPLVPLAPLAPITPITPLAPELPAPADHAFTLRHVFHHGANRHPGLHRKYNIARPDSAQVWLEAEDDYPKQRMPTTLKASSGPMRIHRLADRRPSVVDPMVAMAREGGFVSVLSPSAWTTDHVSGPNITDRATVLNLALIAANAYVETSDGAEWQDVGAPYNRSLDFGWEDDGLRGHVWADESNSTVVIGLKGTSMAVFDGDGTTTNDKVNDNLLFSCCCAQQGPWTWRQVCDCATGPYSCNTTCVRQALHEENRYYQAARELYANVTELYPDSGVWLTGHSLGGAVSSLLGLTYGVPTVTFEAVPEALPAGRLGLPVPPGSDPDAPQTRQDTAIFHFGHTADPVYVGSCNGATASCSFGGYAMESACHTGHECVYDTVGDKGWRVGIGTHKIRSVINDVILKYEEVPECQFTPDCRDCGSWRMYESNGTETSTTSRSSSTTSSHTRTATCQTPGWWGCLDETTTGTATTTSTTETSTTTTCHTPGWFGCKDKTTETTTTTTSTTSSEASSPEPTTATTTCETPGRFWGCKDQTTTATSTSTSSIEYQPPPVTSAPTMPTASSAISAPTPTSTSTGGGHGKKPKCKRRWWWFGPCELKEQQDTGDEGSVAESRDL